MDILGKFCITGLAGLACLLSVEAQAAIVSYQYTAVINRVTEHDLETDTYIGVDASSFAGTSIKLNDTVTGIFRFDTTAPLGSYQPDSEPGSKSALYKPSSGDAMHYRIGSTGYTLASDPALNWLGLYQVHDSSGGELQYDYFSTSLARIDEQFVYSLSLFFFDREGDVFQDDFMPSSFDPTLFDSMSMDSSFLRRSDNGWMSFRAGITSLERLDAAVPEPASLLLLGLGAAGILAGRRRAPRPAAC